MISFVKTLKTLLLLEDMNFLLTNRIPRALATRLMGRFSRVEHPLIVRVSIFLWGLFADLKLEEARQKQFKSVHDCFVRELLPGARPICGDPDILISPCDGIVGEFGMIKDQQLFQAKGFPYSLKDLLLTESLVKTWQNGCFLTIRITSSMYHRFHAPEDGRLQRVRYISGDTWNVNPIALKRVESLFCKNERAILELSIGPKSTPIIMIPVAAILVAGIRIHGINATLNCKSPNGLTLESDRCFNRGDEMGWFEHGSTIIMITPPEFEFNPHLAIGQRLRMGEPIMQLPIASC